MRLADINAILLVAILFCIFGIGNEMAFQDEIKPEQLQAKHSDKRGLIRACNNIIASAQ